MDIIHVLEVGIHVTQMLTVVDTVRVSIILIRVKYVMTELNSEMSSVIMEV